MIEHLLYFPKRDAFEFFEADENDPLSTFPPYGTLCKFDGELCLYLGVI